MTPTQSPSLASQATAELPSLMPVIQWLENGCNPLEAAKELRLYEAGRASRAQSEWLPIETAPKEGRTMFVVRGFDVTNPNCGALHYTTDPHCVWPGYEGGWVRWPHVFPPTHWVPLPATTEETK